MDWAVVDEGGKRRRVRRVWRGGRISKVEGVGMGR